MKQEELTQMFNNRWRIKREANADAFDAIGGTYETLMRSICRDFFEAGVLLGSQEYAHITKVETQISDPNLPDEVVVVESLFETWWNLYQKKRGKEKCMKKWAKLSKKDKLACIAVTPAYVASTPDVTYRKDPYTYLNNKSWNDEIYFRNGTDNKPTKQDPAERLADILIG